MIPVVRLAPGSQWDQNVLDLLLSNHLWPTGIQFDRHDAFVKAPGIVLIIPGRYWSAPSSTAAITVALARYDWVLGIRTSDEEDLLDIAAVQHPNIRWWLQTPRMDRDYDARVIPLGFPPHFNQLQEAARNLDVFLAGQDTHDRRHQAFAALRPGPRRRIEPTPGFTAGMEPAEYVRCMTATKVAPCPAGAVSPDSFRVYEALEAHAVPIADDLSPAYDSTGYWERVLPGCPFPILRNYSDLPGYIDDVLRDYPRIANRTAAYWMRYKRSLAHWLREDLQYLGADIA